MSTRRPSGQGDFGGSAGAVWTNRVVWLVLALAAVRGRPGDVVFDTKFDLGVDPGGFLRRSLTLWNSNGSLGELQNQAYGYLFPQGAFAWLGDAVGVATWVVQRGWSALLFVLAYEGTRRVFLAIARARGARASDAWLAMLAGLCYVGAPRLAGLVASLSSEVNPPALLPWAVLPLLLVHEGRLSARSGGLLAGCGVLAMGGVNAVAVLACLPLLVMVALAGDRGTRGRTLRWLGIGLAGAMTWWLLPLLVLGRYSPAFLDFIETSSATAAPTGWFNSLRGADHWVAFVNDGGQAWWPGAFELHTSPVIVVTSVVVAVAGVCGLMARGMPYRRILVLSLLLGLSCLTLAHGGWAGSVLAPWARDLLDGPLAMLRNVHKVDPLVRLPLALGAAHGVGQVLTALSHPRRGGERIRAVVVAAVVLAAAAAPLTLAPTRPAGWSEVPSEWREVAQVVARGADGSQPGTLVLPSAGFGRQTWGWTVDEPLQPLAESPWITRSQIPLTPPQTLRFLDALAARAEEPSGSDSLADQLTRAGIGWVVVRHDLDPSIVAPHLADEVSAGLRRSSGVESVPGFGSGRRGALELFRVSRPAPVVRATPVDALVRLSGGPEDVLMALEAGAIGPDEPMLIGDDARPLGDAVAGSAVVGDGYRRQERAFGLVRDAVGPTLTQDEAFVDDRPVHDFPGVEGVPLVVADYADIASVHASSSAASPFTLGAVRPDLGPQAAIDGDETTYWESLGYGRPDKQWLEIRLKQPASLREVEVVANVNPFEALPIRQVTVEAGSQSVTADVHPETGRASASLDGSAVGTVRVRVTQASVTDTSGAVALREISLPGVATTRSLVVPGSGTTRTSAFVFRGDSERRACTTVTKPAVCDHNRWRTSSEPRGVSRVFTTTQFDVWTASGRVRARSTPATTSLLAPVDGDVDARSTSVFRHDPAVAPAFAVDGSTDTYWLAGAQDPEPILEMSWGVPRELSSVDVVVPKAFVARPLRATLRSGDEVRSLTFTGGRATFDPIRSSAVSLTFEAPDAARGLSGAPMGIAELRIGGLEDLVHTVRADAATGAICGLGPPVVIDGREYPTKVAGTLGDVIDHGDLRFELCGDAIELEPGRHRVEVRTTSQFEVVSAALDVGRVIAPVTPRDVSIRAWGGERRVIDVAAGPASVLQLGHNLNPGWAATLDGRTLVPVRVDGWQQGFVVPAGAGGTLRLEFGPGSAHRWGLGLGAVMASVLILVTGWSLRRDLRLRREPAGRSATATITATAPCPVPAPASVPASGAGASRPPSRRVLALGGAALFLLASPVTALAFVVPSLAPRRWPARAALVTALVVAAVLTAVVVALWVQRGNSAARPPVVADAVMSAIVGLLTGSIVPTRTEEAG